MDVLREANRTRGNQITNYFNAGQLSNRELWDRVKQGAIEAGEAGDLDAQSFTRRS